MARPRKAPELEAPPFAREASTLELIAGSLDALKPEAIDQGKDEAVAAALATIAVKLDALEARLGEPVELEVSEVEYAEGLEGRVSELEARIDEAGRRMLFASERKPGGMTPAPHYLADVGRVLLFDTETPDREPAADAGSTVETDQGASTTTA